MNISKILSDLTGGVEVELTIRGDRSFTFSTEEKNEAAAEAIADYFRGSASVNVEHDDECGSFVYVEVAA